MKQKFRSMDSWRGICALLIVWHHYPHEEMGFIYTYDFGNTIVLFFFVLSGYHISLAWKDKIVSSVKAFYIKRFAKIFPIQWLTVTLFVLFGINIVSKWAIPFHLTLTQSAMIQWEINFSLNTPSWFLSSLFFCYLCTPFLLKLATLYTKRFVCFYIFIIACFVLFVYILSNHIGTRWLTYINPCARLLDYSAGITLGVLLGFFKHKNVGGGKWKYTAAELSFIALAVVFMTESSLFKFNCYTVLRYPVVLGFIIVFSADKGYISQVLKNRLSVWLGSISMSIYMLHGFVLHFMREWTNIPFCLHVCITFTAIFVISYLTNRYFIPSSSQWFTTAAEKWLGVQQNKK